MTIPPNPSRNQLTPREAIGYGILCIVCGLPPILMATGVLHSQRAAEAPPWVVISAGLAFVLAGLALIAGYGLRDVASDGRFAPEAPASMREMQRALGFGIVSAMCAIFGWIAFGTGERHFSTTLRLPIGAQHANGGELAGRMAFGICAVLMGALLVGGVITGVRQMLARTRSTSHN